MKPRRAIARVVAALLPALAAAPVGAQLGPNQATTGWPGVEVGARVGFDNSQRQEVAGALLRIPVLRSGRVELLPNADVTFLRGLKEYQVNAEAVYVSGGREGGLYAGGGIGSRSTILPSDPAAGRQRIRTYSLVLGAKLSSLGRVHPLLEFRRVFASRLAVDPQQITLGVTISIW